MVIEGLGFWPVQKNRKYRKQCRQKRAPTCSSLISSWFATGLNNENNGFNDATLLQVANFSKPGLRQWKEIRSFIVGQFLWIIGLIHYGVESTN